MDLSRVEQKLETFKRQSRSNDIDFEAIFWRPSIGKHQIRIVPSKYDKEFPFSEIKFHYGVGKWPMIALSNFGEQDPIEKFVQELRKTDNKDNWTLAGKLTPKTRTFAPVVVRGEEDKGVRLWGFSKTVFRALLALAEDEEIGDYTDVVNGFDLVVTVEQATGKQYPDTTVRCKRRESPLSEDSKEVETWLNEQPAPMESFTKYDYDFIKRKLQEHLEGTPEQEAETESTEDTEKTEKTEDTVENKATYSLEKQPSKLNSDITDRFKSVFDKEEADSDDFELDE